VTSAPAWSSWPGTGRKLEGSACESIAGGCTPSARWPGGSQQRLGVAGKETAAQPGEADLAGRLLAHAYPDRIARKRPGHGGDYLMASGTGAHLPLDDPLCGERLLVAADLDGDQRNARIFRAAAYSAVDLEADFPHRIHDEERIEWDRRNRSVRIEKQRRFGALVLERFVP
jgi:ATP-dependent helicase HrpB